MESKLLQILLVALALFVIFGLYLLFTGKGKEILSSILKF